MLYNRIKIHPYRRTHYNNGFRLSVLEERCNCIDTVWDSGDINFNFIPKPDLVWKTWLPRNDPGNQGILGRVSHVIFSYTGVKPGITREYKGRTINLKDYSILC